MRYFLIGSLQYISIIGTVSVVTFDRAFMALKATWEKNG